VTFSRLAPAVAEGRQLDAERLDERRVREDLLDEGTGHECRPFL